MAALRAGSPAGPRAVASGAHGSVRRPRPAEGHTGPPGRAPPAWPLREGRHAGRVARRGDGVRTRGSDGSGVGLRGGRSAAEFVVDDTGEEGDFTPGDGVAETSGGVTTLRAAVEEAEALAGADTITFDAALAGGTIILATADADTSFGPSALAVTTEIEIDGSNVPLLTISGDTANASRNLRLFLVQPTGALTIRNVTIAQFHVRGGDGGTGGGGGAAGMGGAVSNRGALALTNCTLTANAASGGTGYADGRGLGGGIANLNGDCTVASCTIAGNAADDGAGVLNLAYEIYTASLTMRNTIVADNAPGADFTDMSAGLGAVVTDGDGNLIENAAGFSGGVVSMADPSLDVLAENGGPTMTMALGAASRAIDAAGDATAPSRDQRGYVRSGPADIGSFEYGGTAPSPPGGDDGCAAGSGGAAGWLAGALLLGLALLAGRARARVDTAGSPRRRAPGGGGGRQISGPASTP